MISTHADMYLVVLDPVGYHRTCSYWFLVRSGSLPLTAFRSEKGLRLWLDERGLTITEPIRAGTWSTQTIIGTYRDAMHLDARDLRVWSGTGYPADKTAPHTMAEWETLAPRVLVTTRTLSNGRYTEARITHDDDGIRTVHTLNPNVQERVEYDHSESRALMDPYIRNQQNEI